MLITDHFQILCTYIVTDLYDKAPVSLFMNFIQKL